MKLTLARPPATLVAEAIQLSLAADPRRGAGRWAREERRVLRGIIQLLQPPGESAAPPAA